MSTTAACEHCKGPVEVVCYNGQRLRCGCGKTMIAVPPAPPPPARGPQTAIMTPEMLRAFCRVMREEGVASFRAGDVRIDLGAPPTPEESPKSDKPIASLDSTELCACGHYLHDHTEGGCIHGCATDPCEKWAAQKGGVA